MAGQTSVTVGDIAERLRTAGLAADVVGDRGVVVAGITHDSRAVTSGQAFACLRGDSFDGHEFARATVEAGAVALLVDRVVSDVGSTPQIVVADTRSAVGPASAAAWGEPARRLVMVGITGTNGKTTTAHIVAALLEAAGYPTGVIGTLHGPRTTPEAPDLHATLARFVDDGHTAAVMEVSSHALALHRIDGTRFDVVAFTNFGHDHLDLHGSPEAYFRAKSALFTSAFAPACVIDVDDTHGRLLADTLEDRTGDDAIRVTELSRRDVTGLDVGVSQHSYRWRDRDVVVPLGGDFNASNSHMALAIVAELDSQPDIDVDLDRALRGLEALTPVPGRFELVDTAETRARGITVVVDYAHTPDGLERLLEAGRALLDVRDGTEQGQLIAVFGCAGYRDREKRPAMGDVASRLADVAVATSDNPRGEDPDAIIDDVLAGVDDAYRSRVVRLPDRRAAIHHALAIATQGDLVVIAGKGHESTQDLGSETIAFDDRLVARHELQELQ